MITNPPTMLLVAATIAIVPKHRRQRALALAGQDDRAHDGDRVQRVGQRHQRRVQQRRNPPDHFEADERGQHEDVEAGDQVKLHRSAPSACRRVAGSAKNSRTRAFTTSPSRVSSVSRMISSFRSMSQLAVLHEVEQEGGHVSRVHLAGVVGHGAGEVEPADDGDAVLHDDSPGRVSSQFPPRSAARSTITEPGAILSTMSAVTSTGDFLPGITAAVMTTSLSATTRPSNSRWRW